MSSWRRDNARLPLAAGMTLIELMVAMALAVILVMAIYYIYTVTTRSYRVQDQTLQAMEQARFGLDQLRRDVAAAGFLATPNSAADLNVCPKPAVPLRAFSVARAGATNGNANLQPNSVTLMGAFWNPAVYTTRSVIGKVITLQDQTDGAQFPDTQTDFNQVFVPNRLLRIVNAEQFEMYYRIESANFTARTITVVDPVATTSPPDFCGIQGFGVGLEVSVVGFVRYILVDDPDEAGKVDLVRQELDPRDAALQTLMPNATIRVAEYVADLQLYDFAMDTDISGRAPFLTIFPTVAGVLDTGASLLNLTDAARPQDLRYVTLKLTTRTPDEDETWPYRPRQNPFDPIESYEVDGAMAGAARTVTLATRVALDSFQVRNVK
jgi:prepilin-type N-terminal cleavage/methylation domain-containing protein